MLNPNKQGVMKNMKPPIYVYMLSSRIFTFKLNICCFFLIIVVSNLADTKRPFDPNGYLPTVSVMIDLNVRSKCEWKEIVYLLTSFVSGLWRKNVYVTYRLLLAFSFWNFFHFVPSASLFDFLIYLKQSLFKCLHYKMNVWSIHGIANLNINIEPWKVITGNT